MWRSLSSLGATSYNTVLKTSIRYVRLSAQRLSQKNNNPSRLKFKIGGVEDAEKLKEIKGLLQFSKF